MFPSIAVDRPNASPASASLATNFVSVNASSAEIFTRHSDEGIFGTSHGNVPVAGVADVIGDHVSPPSVLNSMLTAGGLFVLW